jgi:hypothetical protein
MGPVPKTLLGMSAFYTGEFSIDFLDVVHMEVLEDIDRFFHIDVLGQFLVPSVPFLP